MEPIDPQDQSPRRHYRVLSVLGRGGFGTVYRARMEGSDGFSRDYAIKLLSIEGAPASTLQRFRDEARILGLIRDRAVIGVQPPTRLGGQWAVVMEYVEGASASALLEMSLFPPTVALEVVQEVCRALHKVYGQEGPDGQPLKLIHRDLKPGNLQITPGGEVKILDFGIARAEFENRESTTTTHIGGTLGYIAPERLQGEEIAAGDIYSMGVVLHQLVTGQMPRRSTKEPEIPEGLGVAAVEAIALSREMRSPYPEERPTAREIERRCRDIRNQYTDAPFLHDWAEEWVPQLDAIPNDEFVGQMLTESHSRDSDSGLFVVADNEELLGLPPPTPAAASTPTQPSATNPTISLPVDDDEAPYVPTDTTEDAFVEPRTSRHRADPPRADHRRSMVVLFGLVGLLALAMVIGLLLAQGGGEEPVVEPAPRPGIRSQVQVADAEQVDADASTETAPQAQAAGSAAAAETSENSAPAAPASERGTAAATPATTEPVSSEPTETTAAPAQTTATPAEVVDNATEAAPATEPESAAEADVATDAIAAAEEPASPDEGSAEPEAEPAADEAAAEPEPEQVPDLRGTWAGKSSGRDVRVLVERQDGRSLSGRVEIVLGGTVRATPVAGSFDPGNGTLRLSEGGGGLVVSASISGGTLSGSMQAREGARPQALNATRQ